MPARTGGLGAAETRLLAELSSRDKTIFTTEDARDAGNRTAAATDVLISNLLRKGWLTRLTRGVYQIVPLSAGEFAEYSADWFVVAKHLIEPHAYYLSHFSALDVHGMTTQPVFTVCVSSPVRRVSKLISGATYKFMYVREENIWGVEDAWVTPAESVRVSDLERTLLDCLARPDACGGVIELSRGLWARRYELDYARLASYVHRFGQKAVAKRLGFLLELYDLGDSAVIESLRMMVTPSYTLLDASLPVRGTSSSRWRIRANVDPEELKAAVET